MAMRRIPAVITALCALAIAGCGGDGTKPQAAPGSPENPLTATQPGDASIPATGAVVPEGEPSKQSADPPAPGYETLLDRQSVKPRERFTPCNLVTAREAEAIFGEPMRVPIEAPQGPTCIYRPREGGALVALAVQARSLQEIRPRMQELRRVDVSNRAAYCGRYGQPVLYVPLGGGRLLSVNAECDVARGFAVKALQRL